MKQLHKHFRVLLQTGNLQAFFILAANSNPRHSVPARPGHSYQQDLSPPGFLGMMLNTQGWSESTAAMLYHPSLLHCVLSHLWPIIWHPALLTIDMTSLPACNLDWLDWSLFIWGRWWWECKCHYLRLTTLLITERSLWGSPSHLRSGRDLLKGDLLWEAGLQRAALSSSWWFCSCLLFTRDIYTASVLKCVCVLSLCIITLTQTFLYENCFAVHQITVTQLNLHR